MDSIFVTSVLNDKITIKPNLLSEDMRGLLEQTLRDKYEGVCSYHGYVKPESIKVLKYSIGHVCTFSLNGDIVYRVQYQAIVCNPVIGNVIRCKVINMNKFGILAEATTVIPSSNKRMTVLDIIIPKNIPTIVSELDLETIRINDEIFVEIKGKKFKLDDKKLSIIGRAVLPTSVPAATSSRQSSKLQRSLSQSVIEDKDEQASDTDEQTDDADATDDDDDETSQSGDEDAEDVDADDDDTDSEADTNLIEDEDDEDDPKIPKLPKIPVKGGAVDPGESDTEAPEEAESDNDDEIDEDDEFGSDGEDLS